GSPPPRQRAMIGRIEGLERCTARRVEARRRAGGNRDSVSAVPVTHFVFLAPCPERSLGAFGPLCRDPSGVDRRKEHEGLNAAAAAFFRRALRNPSGAR